MRPPEEITALVTGATDGLGRSVATELAKRGARVLVHGRDHERARGDGATRSARQPATTGSSCTSPTSPRSPRCASSPSAVAEAAPELNLLINNAGIGSGMPEGRERRESRDGVELRFAVNYLAGFVLTESLLPTCCAATPRRASCRSRRSARRRSTSTTRC